MRACDHFIFELVEIVNEGLGDVMSVEVSPERAAYFTLGRHHLTKRAPPDRAVNTVGDILGLNAQGALNYQLSLWNRVEGLDPSFLPRALLEERSLVRSWFMRDTVHIIPTADLPMFRRGLEESLMREWNRWTVRTGRKESPRSWEPLYPRVLRALDGETLTLNQIVEEVGWEGENPKPNLSRLVREMSLRGLVCHADSSGPWHHSSEHSFARVDQWVPVVDMSVASPADTTAELAVRYMGAYGPASAADFAYWTGGRVTDVKPVIEGVSHLLTEVSIEGQRGSYYIPSEDESAIEAIRAEPFTRLLPQFDALIMGHKDKSRFIDPADRKEIFLPRGDVAATLMVSGKVRGTWSMRRGGHGWDLSISPSRPLSADEREMTEAEIDGMREFTGFEISVSWG